MADLPGTADANTGFYDLDIKHPDYEDQYDDWEKMDDLYTGSDRVKEKSTKYLPATPVETMENINGGASRKSKYQHRLENAVFFNGVDRLAKYAIGHIFREDMSIADNLPPQLSMMVRNADLMGTSLQQFFRQVSTWSYVMGHYFIMIDYPDTRDVESLLVQRMLNPHPFMVMVHPIEIVNWGISRAPDGQFQFDWLTHRYSKHESDGPYDQHYITTYYKVWTRDDWKVYKRIEPKNSTTDLGHAVLVDEGPNTIGVVPYVPVYSQVIRPMVSKPPLLEAANLNIDHYRAMSFFNNGLMYHLNPILALIGVTDETVKVGASTALMLPRSGDAKYVEYQGGALSLGKQHCDSLAAEMWESGMKTSASLGANTSAEARRLSRSDFQSWLTSVVNSHEHGFRQAMRIAAMWAGEELGDVESLVRMNRDFDLTPLEANSSEFLLNARKAGEIGRKTFIRELIRGEVLAKHTDIDELIREAEADLQKDIDVLLDSEERKAEIEAKHAPKPAAPGPRAP